MMKIYERICLKDWSVEAENGDKQECFRGKTYTTTASDSNGMVTVFSGFWVNAPVSIFEPVTPERPLRLNEATMIAAVQLWLNSITAGDAPKVTGVGMAYEPEIGWIFSIKVNGRENK
jgi:hypothetical protein